MQLMDKLAFNDFHTIRRQHSFKQNVISRNNFVGFYVLVKLHTVFVPLTLLQDLLPGKYTLLIILPKKSKWRIQHILVLNYLTEPITTY